MAFYYNPTPEPTTAAAAATSPNPIQMNTFSNQQSRPTIPYKQFKRPVPVLPRSQSPASLDGDRRSGESQEDYGSEDDEQSRLSSAAEFGSTAKGNAVSSESAAASDRQLSAQTRRTSILSNVSNDSRSTSPYNPGRPAESRVETAKIIYQPESASEDEHTHDDEETGLDVNERKSKRGRTRRATLLDQRLIPDGKISDEDKKEADQYVLRNMLVNGLLIILWYIFSLSISIYNKWMFDPEHLDFHFPLFTTAMHMLVQFSLASLTLFFLPQFRPRYDSLTNPNNHSTSESGRLRHEDASRKPLMTRWFYFTRLGPCGVATGLDIGLGNMSLKFITLTFYTMVKSSSLAFVLLFAFLFRLEQLSLRLVAIIAAMTIGVVLMVSGEAAFNLLGFLLILSAAFFSGFRWALTQILLLRNPATSNPFASIFYLAPIMFVSLLILAISVEGIPSLLIGLDSLLEAKGNVMGPIILLFPGTMAFLMTSSEFALLQRTSVVTLSIAGICKEVVTISAAALVFHDEMSPINISGLVVTILSIAAYNWIKFVGMREKARMDVVVGKGDEMQGGGARRGGAYGMIEAHDDEDSSGEDDDDDEQGHDAHHATAGGDLLPKRPSLSRGPKSGRGVFGASAR